MSKNRKRSKRTRRWLLTRRAVLASGSAAWALTGFGFRMPTLAQEISVAAPTEFLPRVPVSFEVNGVMQDLELDPRTSLLDALRETIGLSGTKKGCDHGQCGTCTVHIDGRRVASCLTMAAQVADHKVITIEGLGDDDTIHPMQQAFIDHDALQCGYCTPGQIMAAVACVREGHTNSEAQIREYMSGNLCRCGAYPGIVAAIQDAAPKMEG
ncbi:Aerobic-type carbon monoxide dehydrogenase, small subunit CoxS/CutS-like protein [Roseovarius mucosus DSM 17069]|uniref:Aerobic-type carbon monoxide dehydrogenase, small subunit CoxS/CutS-like protein n=1 Tax=Roseovarius mucosus DSM 17069 TaxID=1288298 RepID=A0A0A0HG27_9RHOB|nr:Aerobic-type carbon monoxide dehydrogenase, small subunit CoxS/CutS-like protein [Roseovarius mucosus DSM 17069]